MNIEFASILYFMNKLMDLLKNFFSINSRQLSFLSINMVMFLIVILFNSPYPIAQKEDGNVPRPNVIIFLTDDLGYGDLASYGNPIIKTPNLDQFALEGVRMTDMHSAGTVCSLSRASIHTGRNAYGNGFYSIAGIFGTTLHKDEITLPQLLKEVGYETVFFGKRHLSRLESPAEVSVNEMGFDYSLATSVNAFNTGPKNPDKFIRNGQPVGTLEGWYVNIVSNEAAYWIATKRDDEKPFFYS